jgi:hypothetical protein
MMARIDQTLTGIHKVIVAILIGVYFISVIYLMAGVAVHHWDRAERASQMEVR